MNITPTHVTFEQAKWIKDVIKSEAKYDKNGFLFHSKDYHSSGSKFNNSISAPEQWQVVEWLRLNHGIWISVSLDLSNTQLFDFEIQKKQWLMPSEEHYDTPQAAYSAAFDYVLKNLI